MRDDGGAAFPRQIDYRATDGCMMSKEEYGMSLRDYFAALALNGNLSCPESSGTFEQVVKKAYEYADAMIAARKEER